MRNGDLYKIQGLAKSGVGVAKIVKQFSGRYSEEEILSFLPKIKRKRRTKAEMETERQVETPADDIRSSDM